MGRRLAIVGIVLAAALGPGAAARADVPPASCQLFENGPAPSAALDVGWTSRFSYAPPPDASSVSGSATVDGHPGWAVFVDNHTDSAVTNPSVTLRSQLDPGAFDGEVPSFPFSCSLPSLDPGQELQIFPGLEATGLHSSFSLGYDSTRSVSPTIVPAGGGDVTVTFTVTLTDASRYAGGAFVSLFLDHGGDVSIVSEQPPTNLDQGESASPSPNAVQNPSADDGVFALSNAQLDKTYTFSAVVHVGPTLSGQPWTWVPGAQIYVNGSGQGCTLACDAPGSSVGFSDSTFGSVDVSVEQSDRRWNVIPDTQWVTIYQDGLYPDLDATVGSGTGANVSATTDAVAHGTSLGNALWGWQLGLGNRSGDTVTEPAISVASGYDASQLFPNFAGVAASSLPIVVSEPSLGAGAGLSLGLGSFIPATVVPGCDTSRSVTPATVPAGGGDQKFTFSVTCFDPAVRSVNGGVQQFLPGSTVVSFTPPANLDQGEGLNFPPDSWFGAPNDASAGFGIGVENLVTGKPYTFTFVVHSPNPFGVPYAQTANIGLQEDRPQPTGCTGCGGPSTSVTVAEPTLDGPTAGAGQVIFSAGEPHIWAVDVEHTQKINYDGTQQIALDYDGPRSAVDGQSVTLTASWEGIEFPSDTSVVFTLGSQSCTAATGALANPFGDQGARCTIVLSQPIGSTTLQVSSPGDVTVYPASTSASFTITGPTSTGQCKDGGWQAFGIFRNQGDCVSYVATTGRNEAG